MNSFGINGNPDCIACVSLRTRRNASDKILLTGLVDNHVLLSCELFINYNAVCDEVEIDFSTHKLCNINICIKCGILESLNLNRGIVNALGTNACDNFLADIFLKLGSICLAIGKLELDVTE